MLGVVMGSDTSQYSDTNNSLTYADMILISENYIDVLIQNGKLKNSSESTYKYSINYFVEWLSDKNNDSVLDSVNMYTRNDIIDFINCKYKSGKSSNCLRTQVSILYCLNRALKVEGYNVPNIAGLSLDEILKDS